MKPYSILIIGTYSGRIASSIQMFTYGLIENFKQYEHIKIEYVNDDGSNMDYTREYLNKLGTWDFVLVHCLCGHKIYEKINFDVLRKKTKYKIMSFLEITVNEYDFCFTYLPTKKKESLVVNAPCLKSIVSFEEKEPKTILLDHGWPNDRDKTMDIIKWLNDVKDEFKIYKMIRHFEDRKLFPDYINIIEAENFETYLKITNKFETFICTHPGSYNSTVIDMIMRGINVIVPYINFLFIPEYNIKLFKLPVITNKQQLLSELKNPIDKGMLINRMNKCTDMKDVVKIINNKIQEWL